LGSARSVASAKFVTLMVVALLLILGATLLRAAYVSGGGAALALEAFHAATDVVATSLVIGAVAISRSRLARRFPYGLYKLEDLVSLGIAVALVVVAADLGIEGFSRPAPRVSLVSSYAQLASIPLVVGSGFAKLVASREVSSPAIRSDAMHTFGDAFEGLGVGLGLLLASLWSTSVAYRVAVGIAVAGVLYAAYEAGRDGLLALLDLPLDRETLLAIEDVVRSVARGFTLSRVRCRWAGPALFVELVLEAPPLAVVEDLHGVARAIEEELSRRLSYVVSVTAMFVPRRRERLRVCIPCDEPSLDSRVSQHFARARVLAVIDVRGEEIERVEFVESAALGGTREKLAGASVAEALSERGVTDVVVYRMGEIAYALFLRHRIVVWRVRERVSVREALEKLLRGELERMVSPTCEASWARHR